jgi:branched-chain amino acid transport system substrate-binding protein
MKNAKKFFALVLALAMALSLAACGGSGSAAPAPAAEGSAPAEGGEAAAPAASGDVIKLGGIGPTTGAAAIYGTATKNGAQIAVDEINALGGQQFELNWQDDEHDPEKSVNAYNTLKDWGMQALVGTTTTGPSVAVSAEAQADNLFMLTPSASSVDVIGGQTDGISRKENVFQMCFTDPNQGTASAEYISTNNLGSKIAVIYNNSDAYSTGIYNKFQSEADERGMEIVSVTTFTDDTANDFSVQLNDAKNNGADLVFLPIYYQPASLVLTQAKEMNYAPKFFGVDGMDGILTLEGFDTSLAEGVMLLTPFTADAEDEKTQNFVKTYQEQFGDVPNQFAADAYDCVYAIYAACEKAGVTADTSASDLCDALKGVFTGGDLTFDGITGTGMTWSETGEVSKSPKGMVIQNGAYVGM